MVARGIYYNLSLFLGPMQKEPPKNFEPTPIAVEEQVLKPEIQALPSSAIVNAAISPEETSKVRLAD